MIGHSHQGLRTFRVVATYTVSEVYHVRTTSKEEAMNLVLDGEAGYAIDEIEGDLEVYYPDITEINDGK